MLLERHALFPNTDTYFHLNDRDHSFPYMHTHDFYEFFAVLSGEVHHTIDGRKEIMSAGSAALVFPENCHLVDLKGDSLLMCISFSASLMGKIADLLNLDLEEIPRRHRFLPEEIDYLLRESKRAAISQEPSVREALMKSVLVTCLSRFQAAPVPLDAAYPEWFSTLLTRLTLPEVFTKGTREICALAGYSPEYVARCFRKYLGTTLTDYTQQMRIHYARGLLLTTDLSVLDICYECGFRNLSHFYRCFQKVYGLSPKRYKDQNGITFPE